MDATKARELKLFIDQCRKNPAILSDPSIAFFRDYLESMGAKLPAAAYGSGDSSRSRDASIERDPGVSPIGVKFCLFEQSKIWIVGGDTKYSSMGDLFIDH